jgi:hypothetical protein
MSRHALTTAAIDDDGIGGTETTCGARRVEGGIPAAVDRDAAAEQRGIVLGHPMQKRYGVEDVRGVACRNLDPSRELGADGQEDGVESSFPSLALDVEDGVVEFDVDAEGDNALDLRVEDGPGKAVGGDAIAHHAAKLWRGVNESDFVAQAA